MKHSSLKYLLFFVACSSSVASAATFNFSGKIANHNDVVRINFSLAHDATNVKVWTDSFMSGTNFDPITALWNSSTGSNIAENDDQSNIAPGQTFFDSGFSLPTLAAGDYFFTVATYANRAKGGNISDGFRYDNEAAIPLSLWRQPANGFNMGTFWRVNLDGVDSASGPATPPNAVPVPAAIWLFGSAIAGFMGFGRKKQA